MAVAELCEQRGNNLSGLLSACKRAVGWPFWLDMGREGLAGCPVKGSATATTVLLNRAVYFFLVIVGQLAEKTPVNSANGH